MGKTPSRRGRFLADKGRMATRLFWIYSCFFFAVGGCIGSFLNVVIWRLPHRGEKVTYLGKTQALTLSWPPSHCPLCDTPIAWYYNVPVLGWIVLGGKCAKCRSPIALRYPLVELATALLFVGLFWAYFAGGWPRAGVFGDFSNQWPVLILHLFLIASLLAASAIDADWYIIPAGVTELLVVVGLIAAPLLAHPTIPTLDPKSPWAGAAIGGALGLILANILLWRKLLPRSFMQLEEEQALTTKSKPSDASLSPRAETPALSAAKNGARRPSEVGSEPIAPLPAVSRKWPSLVATFLIVIAIFALWMTVGAAWASFGTIVGGMLIFLIGVLPRDKSAVDVTDEVLEEISVPEARREILKEILFLAIPVLFAVAGAALPLDLPSAGWLARLLGSLLGILAGGGIVWGVRVFGTLLFGKEAMGLGDVHLMAAVGAILGWQLVVVAFFVAPFFGLVWAVVLLILRRPNILPFGPWLSMASILTLVVGPRVVDLWLARLGG